MNVESATRQLHKIWECGQNAGIEHAMFVNFGTLLGYVRDRALIPWDDDTDVSVRSDWITPTQEVAFYEELCKANMFAYRRKQRMRTDSERAIWWSLKSERQGTKSCIWFVFPWGNHIYHSKGHRWIRKIGHNPIVYKNLPMSVKLAHCSAFAKGNCKSCFDELIRIKWLGGKFRIPIGYGTLLDEYYPNWAIPKVGGASARNRLVLIQSWKDQSSWLVIE